MARVVRCHLRSPPESLPFWCAQGPFRYTVHGYYDENLCQNRDCSRDSGFDMDRAGARFYTTGLNLFSRGANHVRTG